MRLQQWKSNGESQHTEWNESWRDDLLRWVSGFANAEGGRLEIGRNNKGEIVGLVDAPKLLEDLPNKIRDLLGILVAVNLHHTAGKPWLVIELGTSTANPLTAKDLTLLRRLKSLHLIFQVGDAEISRNGDLFDSKLTIDAQRIESSAFLGTYMFHPAAFTRKSILQASLTTAI